MEYRNADVIRISIETPDGHCHLRTTLTFADGTTLTLQEATVANLVRAFLDVKTHPVKTSITLTGRELAKREGKKGFASWQLLESEE